MKVYTGIELLKAYHNGEIDGKAKLKDYNQKGELLDVKSYVISALCYYRAIDLLKHTFELIEDEEIDIDSIEEIDEANPYIETTDKKINELIKAVKQLNKTKEDKVK